MNYEYNLKNVFLVAYRLASKFFWCYGPSGFIVIAISAIIIPPQQLLIFTTIATLILTYPVWYFLAFLLLLTIPPFFHYAKRFIPIPETETDKQKQN